MVVLGGTLEEGSGVGLGCMSVSGQYGTGMRVACHIDTFAPRTLQLVAKC